MKILKQDLKARVDNIADGTIYPSPELEIDEDDWRYAQNNYQQTEEQIQKYRDYLKLLGDIRLWREEYNGDWEPDFTKEDEKYYMYYDYNNKEWDWSSRTHNNQINLLSYYKDDNFFDPFMEKFGDRLHLILEFGNK